MFLGIDVGTSAVKACLTDGARRPVATASVPLTISHLRPGWSEQNPDDWWQAVRSAVARVIAARPEAPGQIVAIGLSGQMHAAVLLDRQDQVLRPAILWNDGRSDAECRHLEALDPTFATIAGARPMAGFTAPKIMWLANHEPDIHARIAHILPTKDYIGFRLHGGYVTDPCDAAGTWWFDEKRRVWSDILCDATQTSQDWLPEVRDGFAVAGRLTDQAARELGLTSGIPVAVGAGDAAAGALVAGAVRPKTAFLSLGTSAQLFVTSESYAAAPEMGLHSYAHCLPGVWFQMAAMLNGARPMSWFADVTGMSVKDLLAEAEHAKLDALPLFLPYLTGERTPHGDTQIRAAFYGLANDTGRAEMMRAIVDAIAYSLADAKDAVCRVADLPSPLLVIGGGAQSDLLLQSIANVLDITLHRGADVDVGAALGAARLAAMSVGAASLDDIGEAPETTAVFAPLKDERHAKRLLVYRALYPALSQLAELEN